MASTLRHPLRVVLLVALAAGLNLIPIPLPGDAPFFLGSFVAMPLVLSLRAPWAMLAAAVPMAVTIVTLNQPFGFLIAVAEATWLALTGPGWRGAVRRDLLFWAALGVPGIILLYRHLGQLPPDLVAIVAAKQVFNQLSAVGVGVFLLRHSRLPSWLDDRIPDHRRVRDLVSQSVFLLGILPLVAVAIGVGVLLWEYCERADRETLVGTTGRLAQQLDLFVDAHQAVITGLAGTLSRGGAEPGVLIEELRRSHPAFITMLVTDAAGRVLHTAPAGGLAPGTVTMVDDREYFQRARDLGRTFVSGVFRGRGLGDDILLAISAPVRDAEGRFAGVVEGSLEVQRFAQLVVGGPWTEGMELTLADPRGRVIFADAGTGIVPLSWLNHYAQGGVLGRSSGARLTRFDQVRPGGRLTRFSAYAQRSETTGIIVVAQRPLLAGLEGSGWITLLFGSVGACILGAVVWVGRTSRKRITTPLEYFARAANRQAAAGTVEPVPGGAADEPDEVSLVFRAFNELAVKLQASYGLLQQTNAELDQRVIARTAEAEAARRQAENASRSKTEFLAMTSHEIRTPLNAIIGLAESLEPSVEASVARERLRTIRDAGRRLLVVVNDLLDLSRMEAGKLELRRGPLEVGVLADEMRALFALRAQEQGLWFRIEIEAPRPLWIEADRARLQQVLINLLGNALKFTREGGVTLRISATPRGAEETDLCITVVDTGPGIPPAQQARLFQPYVQLGGAEESNLFGTGLGLFISRRLVDLLGGRLELRSEAGAGTEFAITLGARRLIEPAAAAPAEPVAPRGMRVLAADDNPANQEVLRSVLEHRCGTLVVVEGGEAALEELRRSRFDVALIDLEMPGLDGFAVAAEVRAWHGNEASRGCRLVAFSAHGRDSRWSRCAAAGFHDFVEKPVDRRELWRALRGEPDLRAA